MEKDYDIIIFDNDEIKRKSKLAKLILWINFLKKIDYIYNVYVDSSFMKKMFIAKLMGKKIILHWIGTDVLNIIKTEGIKRRLIKCVFNTAEYNFACYKDLQNELSLVGIVTKILPIIPFGINFNVAKEPNKHAVLIYMPEKKENFYGYKYLAPVFEEFRAIEFFIVANSNDRLFSRYNNVHALGWLSLSEMNELYDNISIVIRYTKHDGLSMNVLEALGKGKEVIWNHQLECIHYAPSTDLIIENLKALTKERPLINKFNHRFIMDNYNVDVFIKKFRSNIK